MPPTVINLEQALSRFHEHWNPKIIGDVSGHHIKLAKLQGEFVWHLHEREDEMFMVLHGTLTMRFRDGDVDVKPGELIVVPAGTEHLPVALEEVHVLLVEPSSTLNTGNVRNERTVDVVDRLT